MAKVFLWGLVLIVLITAGAAWFAYALVTDSEAAARMIKGQAARYLPRSIVEMGRPHSALAFGCAVTGKAKRLMKPSASLGL